MPASAPASAIAKPAPDPLNQKALARMLSSVRDKPSMNRQRKHLEAGRNRLCRHARALARQNPSRMSEPELAARAHHLSVLRRMCQAQYILRTREMSHRGIPPQVWKQEPDHPRIPGSNADIIAHANRVATASATRNEDAINTAVDALLNAARHKPPSP